MTSRSVPPPFPLKGTPRLLVTLASLVIVVAGLKAGRTILLPVVLAVFLTILSVPILNLLKRRLPFSLAVALTVMFDGLLISGFGYLLSLAISRVTARAPAYQEAFQNRLDQALGWLESHGVEAQDWISAESISPAAIMDVASSTFFGVASVLTFILVVLLLLVFMLLEVDGFPRKIRAALGIGGETLQRYSKIVEEVQRYLVIKTLVSLATGVSVGVWVSVVGLDFPFLLGIIAFVLNYIPNIGSILAVVPALAFSLVQLSTLQTVLVLLGYLVINVVWGNLVEPSVLGRRLKISSFAVFVSLIFWGWMWGALGMLLAVPILMVLKIFFENSDSMRWLAVLLDPPERRLSEDD